MKYRCNRCAKHGEYHKGPVTGGSTGKYYALKTQINASSVLSVKHSYLCMECMEDLLKWLRNKP